MKSLKEFITESLEQPSVPNVKENTEKQVDENNNQETVSENVEAEKTEVK